MAEDASTAANGLIDGDGASAPGENVLEGNKDTCGEVFASDVTASSAFALVRAPFPSAIVAAFDSFSSSSSAAAFFARAAPFAVSLRSGVTFAAACREVACSTTTASLASLLSSSFCTARVVAALFFCCASSSAAAADAVDVVLAPLFASDKPLPAATRFADAFAADPSL